MTEQEAMQLIGMIAELSAQRPLSLARLSKQSGRAMSTLLRQLAVLEGAGIVRRDGDRVSLIPAA